MKDVKTYLKKKSRTPVRHIVEAIVFYPDGFVRIGHNNPTPVVDFIIKESYRSSRGVGVSMLAILKRDGKLIIKTSAVAKIFSTKYRIPVYYLYEETDEGTEAWRAMLSSY